MGSIRLAARWSSSTQAAAFTHIMPPQLERIALTEIGLTALVRHASRHLKNIKQRAGTNVPIMLIGTGRASGFYNGIKINRRTKVGFDAGLVSSRGGGSAASFQRTSERRMDNERFNSSVRTF